jgi:hypothetical protein
VGTIFVFVALAALGTSLLYGAIPRSAFQRQGVAGGRRA